MALFLILIIPNLEDPCRIIGQMYAKFSNESDVQRFHYIQTNPQKHQANKSVLKSDLTGTVTSGRFCLFEFCLTEKKKKRLNTVIENNVKIFSTITSRWRNDRYKVGNYPRCGRFSPVFLSHNIKDELSFV